MDEIHFRQIFWLESIYLREISFQSIYGWFGLNYDIIGKKNDLRLVGMSQVQMDIT
jgi:hypothetical protein